MRGCCASSTPGDFGAPDVVERLRRIAPVTAIRGNADVANWAKRYPETETVHLKGRCFHLLHDLRALAIDPVASRCERADVQHDEWAALPASGKRRSAALQATDHTVNARSGRARPAAPSMSLAGTMLMRRPCLGPTVHDGEWGRRSTRAATSRSGNRGPVQSRPYR